MVLPIRVSAISILFRKLTRLYDYSNLLFETKQII